MPAQPVSSRPTLATRVRDLSAGAPVETLVLAVAVPPLFLHATYQPHVSVGLGSTTVDVTLADVAIAAVVAAAALRGRRDGLSVLRPARWVLAATGLLVTLALLSLATPAVLGEEYAYAPHVVSALKLVWYALLAPSAVLLVRGAREAVPLFRAVVLWSLAATAWGTLQLVGAVDELQGRRPWQREPSFLGTHDFAALSGAALTVGLAAFLLSDGRPLSGGRGWTAAALVAGAGGLVLSGALTGVGGLWLATAALLVAVRALTRPTRRRVLATVGIVVAVTAGATTVRAESLGRFAEFLGLRERVSRNVESYAQRTLLAYIGGRIWLDHPVTGVGWQASSEEWAYGPYLDDARRRFPDEPAQAFPSPAHPWGVQSLYVQVLADMGVIGFAALLAVLAAAVAAAVRGIRGSPVPLVGLAWLLVAVGVWGGIGIVPGIPLAALTFVALGLVTVRG